MNEQIKKLAEQAYALCGKHNNDYNGPAFTEAFAALVAAHEREALEKIDWTALMREGNLVTWGDAQELGDRVLAAIRARGTT